MSGDALGDMVCGVIAGTVGKVTDYPLDTVKTRLQAPGSSAQYSNGLDCFTSIARKEGVRGFYAGIGAPVLGAAVEKAFIFAAYNKGKQLYDVIAQQAAGSSSTVSTPGTPEPISRCIFGGSFSGLATGVWNTPVELVKCKIQVFPGRWSGVLACTKDTFATGGVTGLTHGMSACLSRECFGNAFWFGAYELMIRACIPPGATRDQAAWWVFPIAGGVAGVAFWTLAFPFDTIKTQMQVSAEARASGIAGTFRRVTKTGGLSALFRGVDVTVVRAFPASAAVFATYEVVATQWRHAFHPSSVDSEMSTSGAEGSEVLPGV